MENIIHINTTTYLVGDTHALLGALMKEIQNRGITGSSFIILGDISLGIIQWEEEMKLRNCETFLASTQNELYLIRGNHDNPAFWREGGEKLWPQAYQHIHFVRDGQLMMIQGKLYVAFGGGISVDRMSHNPLNKYWPDENFVPPTAPIEGLYGVLAHIGPFSAGHDAIQHLFEKDDKLESDLIHEEKTVMDSIELLQPAVWYGGHYHRSETLQIGNTHCRCLDKREIYQLPE